MKNYKSQVHRFLGRGLEVNFLNPFENSKTFQDKLFPKRFETLTQTKPEIHKGDRYAARPLDLKISSNRSEQIGIIIQMPNFISSIQTPHPNYFGKISWKMRFSVEFVGRLSDNGGLYVGPAK